MSQAFTIDPAAHIGCVSLTVSDLARSEAFYRDVIGLEILRQEEQNVAFTADGSTALLEVWEEPSARKMPRTTGLYHFAILVPSRQALAASLRHLAQVGRPPDGAADHSVSEALYMSDPDGNGIEIYCDRPRSEWKVENGEIQMDTEPLRGLLDEQVPGPWNGLGAETRIGHIHLHVRDLDEARRFYEGVLGFPVVARYGPGALFVSAGGYHHHIGLNIWNGVGAPPPPPGSVGLRHFTVELPSEEALDAEKARLEAAGVPFEAQEGGVLCRDPSENGVVLRLA